MGVLNLSVSHRIPQQAKDYFLMTAVLFLSIALHVHVQYSRPFSADLKQLRNKRKTVGGSFIEVFNHLFSPTKVDAMKF